VYCAKYGKYVYSPLKIPPLVDITPFSQGNGVHLCRGTTTGIRFATYTVV